MGQAILIDTSVAISIAKGRHSFEHFYDAEGTKSVFISAVTVFELLLRKTNLAVAELIIGRMQVLPFDERVARIASAMTKSLERRGTPVDYRDVFIAATAKANDCAIATLDISDFARIEGVELVHL